MTKPWLSRTRQGFAENATSINVDIFRSFLAQWVIVAHLASALLFVPLIPGRLAVWGFFVVSGYLNAISFSRCLANRNWGAATCTYYGKRVRRIYPVLLVSYLIVSALLSTLANQDIFALIPFEYFNRIDFSNAVLWTLVIEIQLYVITPFLFLFARKISRHLPLTILLLMSAGLIYLVTFAHVAIFDDKSLFDDRTMLGNLGFYLFGMFVAFNPQSVHSYKSSTLKSILTFTGVATVAFLGWYNFKSPVIQFTFGQVLALAFSFYFLASQQPVLHTGHRIYRFLGYFTYEIYVLHGLFVYIFHYLQIPSTAFWIIIFAWALPMLTVLLLSTILFNRPPVLHQN